MSPAHVTKGFLGFMDHSVTEQLRDRPDEWHTTALLLSEGAECQALANRLAAVVNPSAGRLRKWSKARPGGAYRRTFAVALADHVSSPAVRILVTSATERTIRNAGHSVRDQLTLARLITEVVTDAGRQRWRIGPFVDRRSGGEHFFELSARRAPMVLWIAHSMVRMRQYVAGLLRRQDGSRLTLDWFLYVDKLAGDDAGAAHSLDLLGTIVRRFTPDGNVTLAFFVQGDTVQEDLLADNVAGLFNEHAKAPQRYPVMTRLLETGRVYWERGE